MSTALAIAAYTFAGCVVTGLVVLAIIYFAAKFNWPD